mmetsp:Transcript_4342/g.10253  ORF Transcript_4342/g.10253 Transcript_4342/m.10253 type:complete len:154 (+) Transcript_4342:81-542(+)
MRSIQEIVDTTKDNPAGKFRCCAEIVNVSPRKVEEFVRWSNLDRQHVCLFTVTLQDATASLPALVAYEDFEEFTGVAQSDMKTTNGLNQCAAVISSLLQPGMLSEVCLKTCAGRDGQLLCRVFATKVLAVPRKVPLLQQGGGKVAAGGKRKRG